MANTKKFVKTIVEKTLNYLTTFEANKNWHRNSKLTFTSFLFVSIFRLISYILLFVFYRMLNWGACPFWAQKKIIQKLILIYAPQRVGLFTCTQYCNGLFGIVVSCLPLWEQPSPLLTSQAPISTSYRYYPSRKKYINRVLIIIGLLFYTFLSYNTELSAQSLGNKLYQSPISNSNYFPSRVTSKINRTLQYNLVAHIDSSSVRKSFFENASIYSPKRGSIVSLTGGLAYGATMYSLTKYWYSNFEQTAFHFYNDNGEWNQMDKIGHVWTAYSESLYMSRVYQWTGMNKKKAVWLGGALGWTFQASIELLDGFSARWGASPGDIVSNTLGSGLFVAQELLWEEQKFQLKFSAFPVNYSSHPIAVQNRTANLFGTNLSERILKDYNGQAYWLSFSPFAFSQKTPKFWPSFLELSVGYGVDNIWGGFENRWANPMNSSGNWIDYTGTPRIRQFYVSFDIDWSKIDTKYPFVNMLLDGLNIFKCPAPALEINTEGQVFFHFIYF